MTSTDPASLQNLNDIVLPASVGWWPLASGWYLLLGLLLISLTWFIYRSVRRWRYDRYRRAALDELRLLEIGLTNADERDNSLRRIPALLKRTALSVYPRSRVASLSGDAWFEFLNSTVSEPFFTETTFSTLSTVSYAGGELSHIDPQAMNALLSASRSWLKHHRAPALDMQGEGQ